MKRVRDRELALSAMEETEEIGYIKNELTNLPHHIDELDEINNEISRSIKEEEANSDQIDGSPNYLKDKQKKLLKEMNINNPNEETKTVSESKEIAL